MVSTGMTRFAADRPIPATEPQRKRPAIRLRRLLQVLAWRVSNLAKWGFTETDIRNIRQPSMTDLVWS